MPDARAHGDSGGDLATYGLLERNDIHQWFDLLAGHFHPDCIFGLGESIGAVELLQSFSVEPGFCAVVAESSFSTFPEIAVRPHGPALSPRSLVRTHSLITRRRICFPESPLEIWAQPAGSFARRFSRSLRRSSSPHSWPDRRQYSASSLLPHPRAQSKYSSLERVPSADHCGAMSAASQEFEQRVLAWFSVYSPNQKVTTTHYPLITDLCPLPFCISCATSVDNPSPHSS